MKNTTAGSAILTPEKPQKASVKKAVMTLNPEDIKIICKRTVKRVILLSDEFIAFIMNTVEDNETEITSTHFQATVYDIRIFLEEHDFKTVPIDSMDLIKEKLKVHKVKKVDMVLPFRKPPNSGYYLKYEPRTNNYVKKQLNMKNLHVEGDSFIFIAMHPMWDPATA